MTFTQKVMVRKSGDRLTVSIRQRYHPRGCKRVRWRWRIAAVFSLRELRKEERRDDSN